MNNHLVARWNYAGVNVDQTNQLSMSGFIVEARTISRLVDAWRAVAKVEKLRIRLPGAEPPRL